jgi:hypothetical protein
MQKTRKGQLCLQKVTIAVLHQAPETGWDIWTDHELVATKPTIPFGQTQSGSSNVPTCRYHTLK